MNKGEFQKLVSSNIERVGYHINIVAGALEPRFAYTIGLKDVFNFELVFAGGVFFLKDQLLQIFREIIEAVKAKASKDFSVHVESLGTFSLSPVDSTWSELMLLSVFEYYKTSDIDVFQILPDPIHYTLDIPAMSKRFNAQLEPIWQWLVHKWPHEVSEKSRVTTNVDVLLGTHVTELMRWEEDEWEMFDGDSVESDEKNLRIVSLATMLGIDKTLLPALTVDVGKGLWRNDHDSPWNNWGARAAT